MCHLLRDVPADRASVIASDQALSLRGHMIWLRVDFLWFVVFGSVFLKAD